MNIEAAHNSVVLWENKTSDLQEHIDGFCTILESHDDPEIKEMVQQAIDERARYNKKLQKAQSDLDAAIGSILSSVH